MSFTLKLVYFSKSFRSSDVADLIQKAHQIGVTGYDLAVRPGYAVSPDNVETLPAVVKELQENGLEVPMLTAPTDLLRPDDERSERILRAMDAADVRLLKIGYFHYSPTRDYWEYVDEIRRLLKGWESLAAQHQVTVCYHTHSGNSMGLNASALAHLIHGFDPDRIGGYLDPGHLLVAGEQFQFAVSVLGDQLKIIGAKDRDWKSGKFVPAGAGDVDWDTVFHILGEIGFKGPVSVHAEYECPTQEEHFALLPDEIAFFKEKIANQGRA